MRYRVRKYFTVELNIPVVQPGVGSLPAAKLTLTPAARTLKQFSYSGMRFVNRNDIASLENAIEVRCSCRILDISGSPQSHPFPGLKDNEELYFLAQMNDTSVYDFVGGANVNGTSVLAAAGKVDLSKVLTGGFTNGYPEGTKKIYFFNVPAIGEAGISSSGHVYTIASKATSVQIVGAFFSDLSPAGITGTTFTAFVKNLQGDVLQSIEVFKNSDGEIPISFDLKNLEAGVYKIMINNGTGYTKLIAFDKNGEFKSAFGLVRIYKDNRLAFLNTTYQVNHSVIASGSYASPASNLQYLDSEVVTTMSFAPS